MNRSVFALVLVSVLMSSAAQIILKLGMTSPSVSESLAAGGRWQSLFVVATNAWVIGGLALYFLSAVVWLLVLARIDVSIAYPLVGIGFIVTMLLAWLIRSEPVTVTKLLGTVFIASGVYLLARS